MKAMAGSVVHTGDIGAGNATKLAKPVIVALEHRRHVRSADAGNQSGVNPIWSIRPSAVVWREYRRWDAKAPMVMDRNFRPGFRIDLAY